MQLFPICVDRKPLELTGIKISTLYYNSILHESVTGSTKLCMFLIQSEGLSLCYLCKLWHPTKMFRSPFHIFNFPEVHILARDV